MAYRFDAVHRFCCLFGKLKCLPRGRLLRNWCCPGVAVQSFCETATVSFGSVVICSCCFCMCATCARARICVCVCGVWEAKCWFNHSKPCQANVNVLLLQPCNHTHASTNCLQSFEFHPVNSPNSWKWGRVGRVVSVALLPLLIRCWGVNSPFPSPTYRAARSLTCADTYTCSNTWIDFYLSPSATGLKGSVGEAGFCWGLHDFFQPEHAHSVHSLHSCCTLLASESGQGLKAVLPVSTSCKKNLGNPSS